MVGGRRRSRLQASRGAQTRCTEAPAQRQSIDMRIRLLLLSLFLLPTSASALTVLSSGKSFSQRGSTTVIRVGADPELATLVDPSGCPSAATVRITAYPTARNLV